MVASAEAESLKMTMNVAITVAPGTGADRVVRRGLPRGVALGLMLCAGWLQGAEGELKVGDPFPDLAKFSLEGTLPSGLEGKVVVVDFWASWCGPCRQTFPLMEELHHRFAKQGLVIVAVNEDKSRAAMNEFLKEYPVTFAVVRDAKKALAATVNVPGLPSSYLLDRRGRVRLIRSGERIAQNRREFVREVESLLAASREKQP